MALWPEIHCEYWFQPWPFESPNFWLLHWFRVPPPHLPPPSPVSLSAVCHTLNLGSLWPKSWWVASLFSGQLLSAENELMYAFGPLVTHTNMHTHTCPHTHIDRHTQIYSVSLLDLWLASVFHNTSQGWLLFCSSSKNVHSPFPPLLFLLIFFHCGGRNCGLEFRPSLPTACPDY